MLYLDQPTYEHRDSIEEQRKSYLNLLTEEDLKSYLHYLMAVHRRSYRYQGRIRKHWICKEHYLDRLMEKKGVYIRKHRKSYLNQLMDEILKSYLHQLMEEHLRSYLHQPMEEHRKSYLGQLMEEYLKSHLHQLMAEYWESGIKQNTKLQGFVCPELFRGVRDGAFKINLWRNIPKGFQNLLDCVNGEILTCVSPEMKLGNPG